MHRFTIILLVLAAAAALAAPASADDRSPEELLAQYQPVTVLDRTEQFAPIGVDGFLDDAVVETRQPDGSYAAAQADELPVHLPDGCDASQCLRLNVGACFAGGPVGSLPCYAANAPSGPSVIYGRYDVRAGTTVLQYWLFYYDNLWSLFYPANDVVWQSHEGDWEVVTIVLDSKDEPVEAAYSEHCTGARRAWSDVTKWSATDHPLVFVAAGSHANYFTPGVHAIDLECYPPEARDFFRARGVTPLDFAFPGRTFGPSELGVLATTVERIHDNSPRWVRFPGRWGEEQYVHAPQPIGTVAFGDSPVGPAFHDEWNDPLAVIATYAAG